MKTSMTILIVLLLSLIAVVALIALVGSILPKGHVVSMTAAYRQLPESLWNVLTDVERYPSWRSGVDRVEIVSTGGAGAVWREFGRFGAVTMERVEVTGMQRCVVRIADTNLAFGGRWIYRIEPTAEGSRLTVTEEGEVYNPIFRFLSRFIFGHTKTIEEYLISLGTVFGEKTVPIEAESVRVDSTGAR